MREHEHSAEEEASYYALPGLDHGLIQSPVNILSTQTQGQTHEVEFAFERRGADGVINKGHTIELEFPEGMTLSFDGREYSVIQTHFHTPSEHRIDGMTYPMEMHVVSMAPAKVADGPPEYLVVALLFRMGASSSFMDRVIASVPEQTDQEVEIEPIYMTELFAGEEAEMKKELGAVYHYRGSLTTPPYSETVEWLVLKHEFEASPEQIQTINKIEGDNARQVQMLFGRTVEE